MPEESNPKRKPETVLFYNKTKVAVDVLDQMARLYSCKAASRRWPMHVFYNVLDMSLINARIVYKEVCQSSISRRCFNQQVASELTGHKPLEEVEHGSDDVIGDEPEPRERKTCRARNCNKNRTTDRCAKCQKPVCGKCAIKTCPTC